MKRYLCAVLCLLWMLSACAQTSHTDDAIFYTFTDDTGVTVTLSEKPKTVAVLFSSFAEIWQLAGGTVDITVGESVERGFADSHAILVDDGAGKSIDTEVLANAQPDLVLCSADITAQTQAAVLLNNAGIPAACFQVETFDDYLRVLYICTALTENQGAYAQYGTAVASRIDALLAPFADSNAQTAILFVRAGSGASATKAKTAEQHFAAAMLKQLGTHNIAEDAPVLLDGLSLEAILTADPDMIFVSTMGDADAAKAHIDAVLSQPAWQALTAVKTGRVIYLPKELFQFKPNAKWDEAYTYLIEKLYEE